MTKIIQSAKIAAQGENGNGGVMVNMQQSPVVHIHLEAKELRDMLRLWLQTLPEPRWNYAKAAILDLTLEICGGNQSLASLFLGRSRRVTQYHLQKKNQLLD